MTDPTSVFPVQASDVPLARNVEAVYNGASGLERRRGDRFWLNAWRAARADAGNHWHHGATQRRADQAAGVIAALSQLKGWDHTLELALETFANHGEVNGGTFPAVADKVAAIFAGKDPYDVLKGPKVRATYGAIIGKGLYDDVAVDRHTAHVAYGRIMEDRERNQALRKYVSRDGYAAVVAAYRAAANQLGLPAAKVQATCRIAWCNALLGEDRGFTAAEREELPA